MLGENVSFKDSPSKIVIMEKPFDGEKDKKIDVFN